MPSNLRSMYNIDMHYKRRRDKTLKPEDCDEFVARIRLDFLEKWGVSPNTLHIPPDHTGKDNYAKITIEDDAKPEGHYYLAVQLQGAKRS